MIAIICILLSMCHILSILQYYLLDVTLCNVRTSTQGTLLWLSCFSYKHLLTSIVMLLFFPTQNYEEIKTTFPLRRSSVVKVTALRFHSFFNGNTWILFVVIHLISLSQAGRYSGYYRIETLPISYRINEFLMETDPLSDSYFNTQCGSVADRLGH